MRGTVRKTRVSNRDRSRTSESKVAPDGSPGLHLLLDRGAELKVVTPKPGLDHKEMQSRFSAILVLMRSLKYKGTVSHWHEPNRSQKAGEMSNSRLG